MSCPNCGSEDVITNASGWLGGEPVECLNCDWDRASDPDMEQAEIIVERVDFAECSDCGGDVVLRVWGEGIDSEIWCEDCDNKEIYR